LAKVDADTYKKAAGEYGVRGFPTLFFFINGSKIDYKGDRTKDGIISWVNKKILPVTVELNTEADYTALIGNDAVSVVLFTTDNAQIEAFQNLARADDHNRYYIAAGDLQDNEASGTVKLIRNFD
jgi:protein disulfide-isomerase A1